MKKLTSIFALVVFVLTILSCTKDNENLDSFENFPMATFSVGNFNIELLSSNILNADGNYEWTWKVQQINSGGPNNPGLSHLGFVELLCIENDNIVEVCWSSNGSSWTCNSAVYQVDPSTSNCGSDKLLKIDHGQGRTNYYKIVVDEIYCVGMVPIVLKHGNSCSTGLVEGISCEVCDDPDPVDPGCETAYMFGNNTFQQLGIGNNWGWAQFIENANGVYTYDFHAGAGQNNTNNGYLAGEVTLTVNGTNVHVAINITAPDVTLTETHVYVSGDAPTTSAPGQYSNGTNGTFPDYTYNGGDLWVIVHGVVCDDE
jgi:hypothetical protein